MAQCLIIFQFTSQSWSKHTKNVLISACGDGDIHLWKMDSIVSSSSKPKSCYSEHSKEVCGVDWNHVSEESLFLSCSWDCSIKLWDSNYTTSITTFNSHRKLVFESKFAKKLSSIFMSVSADGYLKIWDILQPQPISTILAHHKSEVISYSIELYIKIKKYKL